MYQATDSKLGRSVAIKLLPDAFMHDDGRTERFEREARVLASLNHPNIAAIHGLDESGGRKFLVMELVPGDTLAERIQRGPIPLDEAVTIANQLLDGLEAAHEKGVIHRDLKPANIKVTPSGQLKVLDFGLAKAISGIDDPVRPSLSNSQTMLSVGATNDGVILGTAAYMSPEQARGRAVDRRTDIFAFGCVLYEMLTGKPAFGGEDVAEILSRVIQREPDWSLLPQTLPPGIRQVLRLCLRNRIRQRRAKPICSVYREFQVSPHGEWVDLDIDRNPTPPNHNLEWNSGYEVKARINEKDKVWYGEMRIPMDKIDTRKPQAGQVLRINFYRFQGPPPDRKRIAWQPTNSDNFHVPEAFGRLRLEK